MCALPDPIRAHHDPILEVAFEQERDKNGQGTSGGGGAHMSSEVDIARTRPQQNTSDSLHTEHERLSSAVVFEYASLVFRAARQGQVGARRGEPDLPTSIEIELGESRDVSA
jgi:hypothetical protein